MCGLTDSLQMQSKRKRMTLRSSKQRMLTTEDVEFSLTDDGSTTIKRKDTGWMYRSSHGALKESQQVFVHGALERQKKKKLYIFEFGFGMGMNFHATTEYAREQQIEIHYEAIDHLPIPPECTENPVSKQALEQARSTGKTSVVDFELGQLILHPSPFQETKLEGTFDAIYHDPFGPVANPECWTVECFRWEYPLLSENGIWTSYGAAGVIRRALAQAGFFVAVGEGIGKKRETTRAAKQESTLEGYKVKYRPSSLRKEEIVAN